MKKLVVICAYFIFINGFMSYYCFAKFEDEETKIWFEKELAKRFKESEAIKEYFSEEQRKDFMNFIINTIEEHKNKFNKYELDELFGSPSPTINYWTKYAPYDIYYYGDWPLKYWGIPVWDPRTEEEFYRNEPGYECPRPLFFNLEKEFFKEMFDKYYSKKIKLTIGEKKKILQQLQEIIRIVRDELVKLDCLSIDKEPWLKGFIWEIKLHYDSNLRFIPSHCEGYSIVDDALVPYAEEKLFRCAINPYSHFYTRPFTKEEMDVIKEKILKMIDSVKKSVTKLVNEIKETFYRIEFKDQYGKEEFFTDKYGKKQEAYEVLISKFRSLRETCFGFLEYIIDEKHNPPRWEKYKLRHASLHPGFYHYPEISDELLKKLQEAEEIYDKEMQKAQGFSEEDKKK